MTFDTTRQNPLKTILCFLSMLVIFKCREYLFYAPFSMDGMTPLGEWLCGQFNTYPFLNLAVSVVVTLFSALLLMRVVVRNMILRDRSFVPIVIYLIVAQGIASSPATTLFLIVAFVLMIAMDGILASCGHTVDMGGVFNASIVIGLASMLYLPVMVLWVLIPVVIIMCNASIKYVIISIFGLVAPLFFVSYVYWAIGEEFIYMIKRMGELVVFSKPEFNIQYIVIGSVFVFAGLLSVLTYKSNNDSIRRRGRRGFVVFVWFALVAAYMWFMPGSGISLLPIIAIPAAVVTSAYFISNRGSFSGFLYNFMIWGILLYNLFEIFYK